MQLSLGKVTIASAGTPERVTKNQTAPTAQLLSHSYLVEALGTNNGKIYIGSSTMDRSTLAGVYAILPPPTTNVFPSFSATVAFLPLNFDMSQIYMDADTSDEGALVSCVQA